MLDILIIGAGPAGLSAAITAKARNKSVLVVGNKPETSSLYKAEKVDNYLGFHNVTGGELINAFFSHAEKMGVEIRFGKVQQILSMGKSFSLNVVSVAEDKTEENFFEAKTIILATGVKRGGSLKGEKELLGKGVSYCATCDGNLYRGKKVAVVGDNEEAFRDAEFLGEICSHVYHITKTAQTLHTAQANDRITMLSGRPEEISGESKVNGIKLAGENIECDGVFIISDSIPTDSLVYGLNTEGGIIVTDKNQQTNIKGVFAAGDCAGKPYQISKGVGEGLIAALSAVSFIDSQNNI